MTILERVIDFLVIFTLVCMIFTWCFMISAIVYTVYHHGLTEQSVELVPTNSPPPIPVCDKELWLRVTEGCKQNE